MGIAQIRHCKFWRKGNLYCLVFRLYVLYRLEQTETAFPNRGAFVNTIFKTIFSEENDDTVCGEWRRDWSVKLGAELKRRKEDLSLDETTTTAVGEYINSSGKYCYFTPHKQTLTHNRWKQKC
jgi:hypothetical protein